MILTKQYRCIHSASCQCTKGHLSEDAIFLVFHRLNWNPKLIATFSCVCKWFDDLAKRVLWKEFCRMRAPKMMLDLQSCGSHSVDGNWRALGKLLIYCSGCQRGGLFNNIQIPGHFVYRTRFSRTSGKSFLLPNCRTDVLYASDPCEHLDQGEDGDVGFFRGVFKSFQTSKVRRMLIRREAQFHPTEVCPYCKAKLWSMLQAKMIPQSASVRLGAYEDCIEYYVCLNGHMLGICTLLPLSDSEEASEDDNFLENSETESMENSEMLEMNTKMHKSSGLVCAEEDDETASKLKFWRGKVVDMQPENNAPRRLKFRRGSVLENRKGSADARRRRFRRGEEVDDDSAETGAEKVVLKHQDVQGKKDAQGLFNNVIVETASKLVETRKSKVKALVGAFETVISLQDKKPSANTVS